MKVHHVLGHYPDEVSLIRLLLRQDSRTHPAATRDLALFNVALNTCFRSSDLVRLRVADVTRDEQIIVSDCVLFVWL